MFFDNKGPSQDPIVKREQVVRTLHSNKYGNHRSVHLIGALTVFLIWTTTISSPKKMACFLSPNSHKKNIPTFTPNQ